ncbi:hypothetical protein NQ318_011094 [Aromia moschata]|uniref:Uncharacterized protein n=1 Tax=Aromia moschata TaxID=1265417 RepID=A0AAV8YTT7_9CUCU|nr:hypothetical protein NQ318_011094 [Aromia moschata]
MSHPRDPKRCTKIATFRYSKIACPPASIPRVIYPCGYILVESRRFDSGTIGQGSRDLSRRFRLRQAVGWYRSRQGRTGPAFVTIKIDRKLFIANLIIYQSKKIECTSIDNLYKKLQLRFQSSKNFISSKMGLPPHNARINTNWLNTTFKDRWIGTYGPIRWPARSPDLTTLDFWLWGYIQDQVYLTPPVNEENLRQIIIRACREIPPILYLMRPMPYSEDARHVLITPTANLSSTCNITKTIVHEIVSESLGMRKVCAKLVPKVLTDDQKARRDITKTIVHEIVSESLGMRKVCAKLVPKVLTDDQKARRVLQPQTTAARQPLFSLLEKNSNKNPDKSFATPKQYTAIDERISPAQSASSGQIRMQEFSNQEIQQRISWSGLIEAK